MVPAPPLDTDSLPNRLQQQLGAGYQVEHELGGGGMSRVFVARDLTLNRRIAVKVFPSAAEHGMSAERFRREVTLLASLQHPNIVPVIRGGGTDDLPFFVMPFVEGESLRQRIARGPLLIPDVVAILRDVGRALAYAHARGVVHRDIKPDNILLSGGAAVVADFGVAKAVGAAFASRETSHTLTSVGMSIGTPAYMAPEQAVADPNAGPQVDLYAVGVMAWEMLLGRPPFQAETVSAVLAAHLTEEAPRVDTVRAGVPAALATLVQQCLAKAPHDRPRGAEALLKALDDPAVVSGAVPSLSIGAVARPTHRRVLRWVGAVVVVALAALGGWWMSRRPAAAAEGPVIAVLPLELASNDTADAYLATGIGDEVAAALIRIPGVTVVSGLSARAIGWAPDPAAAARASGVQLILEGTVQPRGNRVRVTAQLSRLRDGAMVWGQQYDRPASELYAVPSELVASLSASVLADLARAEAPAKRRDPEAYDAYLRGHFLLAQRVPSSIREAITHFESALSRDSAFAAAWAELAQAHAVLPLYGGGDSGDLPRAREAAMRAIALDSMLGAAHASVGYLHNGAWSWEEGRRALERAVVLDSTDAIAWQWLGENLLLTGSPGAAARAFGRAVSEETHSPIPQALLAVATALEGNVEWARDMARRVVDSDPGDAVARYMLGTVLVYGGRFADAILELQEARRLAPGVPGVDGTLGYALARAGDRAGALASLRRLEALPPGQTHAAQAKVLTGLGRHADAMAALERAAAVRDGFFASEPLESPIFAALPRDSRWDALLKLIGRVPAVASRDSSASRD